MTFPNGFSFKLNFYAPVSEECASSLVQLCTPGNDVAKLKLFAGRFQDSKNALRIIGEQCQLHLHVVPSFSFIQEQDIVHVDSLEAIEPNRVVGIQLDYLASRAISAFVHYLSPLSNNLKSITIEAKRSFTFSQEIADWIQNQKQLQQLHLVTFDLDTKNIVLLKRLPATLTELHLQDVRVFGIGSMRYLSYIIASAQRLTQLSLNGIFAGVSTQMESGQILEGLSTLHRLNRLSLQRLDLQNAKLVAPNVKYLSIENCIVGERFSFGHNNGLKDLKFRNNEIGKTVRLHALASLLDQSTRIQAVDLSGMNLKKDPSVLTALANKPNLESLALNAISVYSSTVLLDLLPTLQSLKTLQMNQYHMDIDAVNALKRAPFPRINEVQMLDIKIVGDWEPVVQGLAEISNSLKSRKKKVSLSVSGLKRYQMRLRSLLRN